MAELVRISDADDVVYFEGEFTSPALHEIGLDDRVDDYITDLGERASSITNAVGAVVRSVRDSFAGMATDKEDGGSLSGIEVEFGLKVSGSGNWYVAKAGAEVNLNVKVTWDFS